MNITNITEALDLIDDKYILEADEDGPVRKPSVNRRAFIALGSAAAVFALSFLTYRIVSGNNDPAIPDKVIVETNYEYLPFKYDNGELKEIPISDIQNFGAGDVSIFDTLPDYGNPWNENMQIKELPVFFCNFEGFFEPERAIAVLEKIAADHGEKLTDIEYQYASEEAFGGKDSVYGDLTKTTYQLKAKAGDLCFEVCCLGAGGISNIKITLSSDKEITADEAARIAGFEHPVKFSDNGVWVHYYESSDDIYTSILNYNCKYFSYCNAWVGNNRIEIEISDMYDLYDCVGMYPVISNEEAFETLKSDEYSPPKNGMLLPADFDFADVEKTELVYCLSRDGSYYSPYYRFYIDKDKLDTDGMYLYFKYLIYTAPAVPSEYVAKTEIKYPK